MTTTATRPIRLSVPVTQEGFNSYLTLANPCRQCDGDGWVWLPEYDSAERDLCPSCDGKGLLLTAAGEAVMQLVSVFGHSHGGNHLDTDDLPFD